MKSLPTPRSLHPAPPSRLARSWLVVRSFALLLGHLATTVLVCKGLASALILWPSLRTLIALGASSLLIGIVINYGYGYGKTLDKLRFARTQQRFLCPRCLRFAGFLSACTQCHARIPFGRAQRIWRSWRRGREVHCRNCRQPTPPRHPDGTPGLSACCSHCRAILPEESYHARRIVVVGLLRRQDLVCIVPFPEPGTRFHRVDDGETLTYFLNIAALIERGGGLHADHALCDAKVFWTSGDGTALETAQAIDRLQRLTARSRRPRVAWVGCAEEECAAAKVLRARFSAVEFGVTQQELVPAPFIAHCIPDHAAAGLEPEAG